MRTHENSVEGDDKGQVEFCFDDKYYQFNESYSESFTNATAWQAWRAGFREGVKMCLDQGTKVDDLRKTWFQNFDRLRIWCSIGADVENGIWSMLGARQGLYKTMCTDWNHAEVRDFKWLNNYWEEEVRPGIDSEHEVYDEVEELGKKLRAELGIEIGELNADASHFFKSVYNNTPRVIRKRA
jgi:hypothetical protein